QASHIGTALQRQLEALELLGAVDRVKHARPAHFVSAALGFHQAVDADEMAKIRLLRMRNFFDAQLDQEIGQLFVVGLHGVASPLWRYLNRQGRRRHGEIEIDDQCDVLTLYGRRYYRPPGSMARICALGSDRSTLTFSSVIAAPTLPARSMAST